MLTCNLLLTTFITYCHSIWHLSVVFEMMLIDLFHYEPKIENSTVRQFLILHGAIFHIGFCVGFCRSTIFEKNKVIIPLINLKKKCNYVNCFAFRNIHCVMSTYKLDSFELSSKDTEYKTMGPCHAVQTSSKTFTKI